MADLGGHGGSAWQPFYSVGQLAAQLAQTIPESAPLIVGHSLGTYVGLALASRWFGVRVRVVLGIGPKIAWPEADLKAARDLAARPLRCYPTEDEALARYRRVSGLSEELAPGGARRSRAECCTRQAAGAWHRIRARSPSPALRLHRSRRPRMLRRCWLGVDVIPWYRSRNCALPKIRVLPHRHRSSSCGTDRSASQDRAPSGLHDNFLTRCFREAMLEFEGRPHRHA